MPVSVAGSTECNEVLLRIVPTTAAKVNVMDFQIRHPSARLAAPVVPLQYLSTQHLIRVGIKAQTRLFRLNPVHDALGRMESRKASFCGSGRNRKNRVIENSRVAGF